MLKIKSFLEAAKTQGIGMRRRVLLYLIILTFTLFSAFFLIMAMLGVFTSTDQNIQQVLELTNEKNYEDFRSQTNSLMARGITLSQNISTTITRYLDTEEVSVLNDDPARIEELENLVYRHLHASLQSSPCNGVFFILDATVNTEAERADTHRAGVYLRFRSLNSKDVVNKDIIYFRGISSIARNNDLELHSQWDLEIDTTLIPGYETIMNLKVERLAENCYWSERVKLPNTWENMMLLLVPILSSEGDVIGICGMEISEQYFKLYYPATSSAYGSMVSAVALIEDEKLELSTGLLGGLETTYIDDVDSLEISEGKHFNSYVGAEGSYIGQHKATRISFGENQIYFTTLISKANYQKAIFSARLSWVIIFGILFLSMLILSFVLSHRIARPILDGFERIKKMDEEESTKTQMGIQEMDALIAYINETRAKDMERMNQTMPAAIEEMLAEFAEGAKNLTNTEKTVMRLYLDGMDTKAVAEKLSISIYTLRRHNANIYEKLPVNSKDELVLYLEIFKRLGKLDEVV